MHFSLDWVSWTLIYPKETQDRTRKRIKEDLKNSASDHSDYAENTLPKLKRAYIKKCQDFEVTIISPSFVARRRSCAIGVWDCQQDFHSAVVPASNVGQTSVVPVPESGANPGARSHPNLPSSKSSVVSPQPIRPLDRKPSSSGPRNRSPSSSTAFSDLAQQGIDVFTNCATVALTKYQ